MTLDEFEHLKINDRVVDDMFPLDVGTVIAIDPDGESIMVHVKFRTHAWDYVNTDAEDITKV